MTDCSHDWTVKIYYQTLSGEEHLEIRPAQMSLSISRDEYDFCRLKFSPEVGEMLKPHTRYSGEALSRRQKAEVFYDGDPVQVLLFQPGEVVYGNDWTHMKLHDMQKALDDGVVDKHYRSVTLEDAYEDVYNEVSNNLLPKPEFTVPENEQVLAGNSNLLYNDTVESTEEGFRVRELRNLASATKRAIYGLFADLEASEAKTLTESHFAVDFNKISPLKAITELNQKFGIQTWVDKNGYFLVGFPEATGVRHIASANDPRTWRFKDPQISHPPKPINTVIVEGSWIDEPGAGGLNDIADWFDASEDNPQGVGDVIATGIATRTDIDYGTVKTVKSTNAKRDALEGVARSALREEMKQRHSGSVEIDPNHSGDKISEVQELRPGDFLQLVPDDSHFDDPNEFSGVVGTEPDVEDECTSIVHNEIYLVNEVQHTVTQEGGWMVTADIGMYPEQAIATRLRYFNPQSNEYLTEEEVYEFGLFEDLDNELLDPLDDLSQGVSNFLQNLND